MTRGARTARYVAFLRAVNIGGRQVKMDRLRRVFESVKAAEALEREIEAALLQAFGFAVPTFVRSVDDLAAVATHQPFPSTDGASLHIVFLKEALTRTSQRQVLALANDVDDFRIRGREVYWLLRGRFSDSKVGGPVLGKALGTGATVRNSTTVRRMAEKFATRT